MLRILFFVLLPLFLIAQSSDWNSVVDLNLSVNGNDRIDLYTNKDGNHILVENGSTLKYYLYSYSGSQVRSYTIDGSISSTFSKVAGWDGKIYVSFKEGSTIYTKQSTNAGQSWTSINSISLANSTSDGMELWTDSNGLHIVYSVLTNQLNNDYETYYKLSNHDQSSWTNYKTVTDETDMYGGKPSVTTSPDRVHVAFSDGLEDSYTRDKYNTSWQNSQTVATYYPPRNTIIATSEKLHSLYSELHEPLTYLKYKNRSLSGSTWSSATHVCGSSGDAENSKPEMAVTSDDKMHMAYYSGGDLTYREWDGSLSSAYDVMDLYEAPRISANCNDVYVIGITDDGSSGYEIKMRQRDYAPLAPQSLTITTSHDDHPLLQWDSNTEADLRRYRVYRLNGDANMFYVTGTSFEDEDVEVSQNGTIINYEVKAEDWTSNLSTASNQASINGILGKRFVKNETDSGLPENFQLFQNYPNPFNPNTNITFALPQEEFVSLTVYNLKGQKLASLLNEYKEAGAYSVSFNGQSLSSGIYLYKINAGEFSAIKRMLLVK